MSMKLVSLHTYPLKSARGIDLRATDFDHRGLLHDRRYMLVSDRGEFLTQRSTPQLTWMVVTPETGHLTITFEGNKHHVVQRSDFTSRMDVTVWRSTVNALVADDETNAVLSGWLRRGVKLVCMDEQAERYVNRDWVEAPAQVSFADGYPMLVTCTASLQALNEALSQNDPPHNETFPMNRFRPNLVIETDQPWIEDTWSKIKVGSAVFDLVKPCDRCVVTTQDQETGIAKTNEPIATLMKIRRSAHADISGVLFGINCVPHSGHQLAVGDPVEVLETEEGRWPIARRA